MAFDPASLILPGVNLIGSLISSLTGGGGSTTNKTPPPKPKVEFQPMQRQQSTMLRQPMNFDPGAGVAPMGQQDPQMEALMRLRSKLGL